MKKRRRTHVGHREPVRGAAPERAVVSGTKVVIFGMLVGLVGFAGVALVKPALVPLDGRIVEYAMKYAVTGVVVFSAVVRWKPEWLPAWITRLVA